MGEQLKQKWSPEQIAGWLKSTFPNDPEMQVSHVAAALPRRQDTITSTGRGVALKPRVCRSPIVTERLVQGLGEVLAKQSVGVLVASASATTGRSPAIRTPTRAIEWASVASVLRP
ncbi:MAG TPA: hypothetical protein VMT27_01740 [Actinomycetes bacterium]|nr:hypothetical protein [Actinomycetes bacterium]